jgi:HEPN domain-containing protein
MATALPPYPGDHIDGVALLGMAKSYHEAADRLRAALTPCKNGDYAPWRLLALHAIELYLSAAMLRHDHDMAVVRSSSHDLEKKLNLLLKDGMRFSEKTCHVLRLVSQDRHYVRARYAPDMVKEMMPITRLNAALSDVAALMSRQVVPARPISATATPIAARIT